MRLGDRCRPCAEQSSRPASFPCGSCQRDPDGLWHRHTSPEWKEALLDLESDNSHRQACAREGGSARPARLFGSRLSDRAGQEQQDGVRRQAPPERRQAHPAEGLSWGNMGVGVGVALSALQERTLRREGHQLLKCLFKNTSSTHINTLNPRISLKRGERQRESASSRRDLTLRLLLATRSLVTATLRGSANLEPELSGNEQLFPAGASVPGLRLRWLSRSKRDGGTQAGQPP